MRIVVCVKQVPASSQVTIDPETKRLKREGVAAEMNPFDLYALEEALLLREKLGGRVMALSMGPKQAEATLRECLSMGADEAVLLTDRAFAGSDTWATSYALARAVEALGDTDLVLCGKQAIDGDTAQVGPGLAAHLGWPQVTYVSDVRQTEATHLVVERMNEEGFDVVEVRLPAVLTVVKDINTPRVPTLRACRAARRATVTTLTAQQVNADPANLGLGGSPTRVVKVGPPPARRRKTLVLDGPSESSAERLVHELRMHSIV